MIPPLIDLFNRTQLFQYLFPDGRVTLRALTERYD